MWVNFRRDVRRAVLTRSPHPRAQQVSPNLEVSPLVVWTRKRGPYYFEVDALGQVGLRIGDDRDYWDDSILAEQIIQVWNRPGLPDPWVAFNRFRLLENIHQYPRDIPPDNIFFDTISVFIPTSMGRFDIVSSQLIPDLHRPVVELLTGSKKEVDLVWSGRYVYVFSNIGTFIDKQEFTVNTGPDIQIRVVLRSTVLVTRSALVNQWKAPFTIGPYVEAPPNQVEEILENAVRVDFNPGFSTPYRGQFATILNGKKYFIPEPPSPMEVVD
jgi:hypothetical protein